jgi:hypothetical protein
VMSYLAKTGGPFPITEHAPNTESYVDASSSTVIMEGRGDRTDCVFQWLRLSAT